MSKDMKDFTVVVAGFGALLLQWWIIYFISFAYMDGSLLTLLFFTSILNSVVAAIFTAKTLGERWPR